MLLSFLTNSYQAPKIDLKLSHMYQVYVTIGTCRLSQQKKLHKCNAQTCSLGGNKSGKENVTAKDRRQFTIGELYSNEYLRHKSLAAAKASWELEKSTNICKGSTVHPRWQIWNLSMAMSVLGISVDQTPSPWKGASGIINDCNGTAAQTKQRKSIVITT